MSKTPLKFDPMFISTSSISVEYDFASLITTSWQLDQKVPKVPVLDKTNLIQGLDDDVPTDIKSTYLNSIDNDYSSPLPVLTSVDYPTLSFFFSQNMLDVPTSFKGFRSLQSSMSDKPHTRLIGILMRHGRRYYVANVYSKTMWKVARKLLIEKPLSQAPVDWLLIRGIFSQMQITGSLISSTYLSGFPSQLNQTYFDKFFQNFNGQTRLVLDLKWLQDKLFQELVQYSPIFSFSIKRVDKRKFKHSRGKSGKYTIIWKYIPQYKRMLTVLRWLAQDVKLQKGKTFERRFEMSLESFFFHQQQHLVSRLRRFVHSFAFQNFKKTLLRTLRQTS